MSDQATQSATQSATPSAPLTQTPEGTIYEVFARFRDEGLHHVGSVIGANDELALLYAEKLYDEWNWRELMIVARAEMISIISPE